MLKLSLALSALGLLVSAPLANARSAQEIFRMASPSVVVVVSEDGDKVKGTQGSGVVVANGRVVTNCHVLRPGGQHWIKQGELKMPAKIEFASTDKDICELKVLGLAAPSLKVATYALSVGQKVYAIGAPRGLEHTLTDGLISSLRTFDGNNVIQASVPISPGSSGGALLDEEGNLIGITTAGTRNAQNLNFAIPSSLISKLPTFGKRTLARNEAEEEMANAIFPLIDAYDAGTSRTLEMLTQPYASKVAAIEEILKRRIPQPGLRQEFARGVVYEGIRAGLEIEFVLAIAEVESGFNKDHIGIEGERGYMGVFPIWTTLVGDGDVVKLTDTQVNLRYGCVIWRRVLEINSDDYWRALTFSQSRDKRWAKAVLAARERYRSLLSVPKI